MRYSKLHIPKYAAVSKICRDCGTKFDTSSNSRSYRCKECQKKADREAAAERMRRRRSEIAVG